MPEVPSAPRVRWYVGGANVFLWDEATEEWRLVTTPEDAPCREALEIFRTLLLELREKPFYEWRERGRRYRMERWSDAAQDTVAAKTEEWRPRALYR